MTSKRSLLIAIATFITVIMWVVTDIVHSRSQVKIAPVVEELLEPVPATFDLEVVNQLNE